MNEGSSKRWSLRCQAFAIGLWPSARIDHRQLAAGSDNGLFHATRLRLLPLSMSLNQDRCALLGDMH
jgi:hypothetical protein